MGAHCTCRRSSCVTCRNRKIRKDAVKLALEHGGTVPYEMRTLLEDGLSADTIRKVWRAPQRTTHPISDDHGQKHGAKGV